MSRVRRGPLLFLAVRPGALSSLPWGLQPGAVRRAVVAAGHRAPYGVGVIGDSYAVAAVQAAYPRAYVFAFTPPEGAPLIRAIGWPIVVV